MLAHRAVLIVLASAALCCACSHKAKAPPATAQTSASDSSSEPGERDPCSLLEPKELEAVFGGPLAVPPYRERSGTPKQDGDTCVYQDAHFHDIQVDVDWEGGAMVWKMLGTVAALTDQHAKGMLHLADGSEIAGEWDEARIQNCCTFKALRGDQIVSVDFGGTLNVTVPQAATLADAALKRLEKPLSVQGNQGVQAASEYAKGHRYKQVDPCTLLTRAEAEAVVGPLAADPTSEKGVCTYKPAGHPEQAFDLKVDWTGGFRDFREKSTLMRNFNKSFTVATLQAAGAPVTAAEPRNEANPAWEISGPSIAPGWCAVQNDAMVTLNAFGMKHEQQLALLATAMSRLK